MSKANALAGLIGNYDDSEDEPDDAVSAASRVGCGSAYGAAAPVHASSGAMTAPGAIHPAPVPHCPWSACYDEGSGYTYYWNQNTNAVTWEAPPEYLLALKIAQQHLHVSGSSEVSAEEWQLYQQALAEKQKIQSKVIAKPPAVTKLAKKAEKSVAVKDRKGQAKRRHSDDEEKIELITSYYNTDSDSNDESDRHKASKKPSKPEPPKPIVPPKVKPSAPVPAKKAKTKPVEYGPSLPPNQEYTVPIGPELPSELMISNSVEDNVDRKVKDEVSSSDIDQDESDLLKKLKDKAKILANLGGELPTELQKFIHDENRSLNSSPRDDSSRDSKPIDTNIDDLLDEIERKELPKIKSKHIKSDKLVDSCTNSPKSGRGSPSEEFKPLFPSSKTLSEEPEKTILLPSIPTIQENGTNKKEEEIADKKPKNIYLSETENISMNKKKLRISNSVLPERTSNVPYTTKYSQHIEGFSSNRTGLGFSSESEVESPKSTVNYGNGLLFTKGETLNEDKKDESLDDLMELVEEKLKYLSELQPCVVTPVQEMLIQMQTLGAASRAGALSGAYRRRWGAAAAAALRRLEARAAPAGWRASFHRSERRYRYERESDGFVQFEFPAVEDTDMEICTTPPHPGIEAKPVEPPPTPPPARTPPPPAWSDPPPPGVDDLPPLPPEPQNPELDELQSFYNDIAQLETQPTTAPHSNPHTATNSPEHVPVTAEPKETKVKDGKVAKKKSKVKISSAIGMKQKTVSSLVAKWQQVAEEIQSD